LSKKTGSRSRRIAQVLILAAAALVLFHESVFRFLANFLVTSEKPEKADVVVVLAGDSFGERVLTGCEMIRQGYASKALVSGPIVFYGRHEDEFAIQWAVDRGCPREWFEGVPNELRSTKEEAAMFGRILRDRGVKTYLLVTSNFHTGRAARIFRKEIPDMRAVVVAAPYPEFDPDAWWKHRQHRKVFVLEWMKTVTEPFGV
jgi:uncharacterized SAM-binding protein YcdF (DUF218 family)